MAHSTFTLTGKHTTPSGTAHVGTVKVTPNSVIYDTAGAVVMAGPDVVTLDATGAWQLVLPCDSAGLNPATGIGFTVEYLFRATSLEVVSFYATAALAGTTLDAAAIVTTAIVAPPLTGGGGGGGDVVIVDATATTKGIVQLAGDLGGTASAPTVPGLAGKSDVGHTHTQGDVTGLGTALAGKSDTGHTHTEADVIGLAGSLAGKADVGHTHTTAQVAGLDADLAAKADVGHTHTSSDVADFVEAAQDVVGGMIAAAGGTYDDTAGSVTLPAGGGGAGPDLSIVGQWWPSFGVKAGEYDSRVNVGTSGFSGAIYLPAVSYDAASVKVEVAGTAGALLRIGIVDVDGNVLADFGTVAADGGGMKIATTASPLVVTEAGWYLFVLMLQGVTTTVPAVSGQTAIRGFMPGTGDMQSNPGSGLAFMWAAQAGPFPATLTGRTMASSGNNAWVQLRRNA